MRDFLVFLTVLAVVFFGVGEWRGWFVGVTGQTPVFAYKSDVQATASRRAINRGDFPVQVSGRVRGGTVTVRVIYADTGSFQTGRRGRGERVLLEESYHEGQRIAIDELVEQGRGEYTIELTLDEASGVFRVPMPGQATL